MAFRSVTVAAVRRFPSVILRSAAVGILVAGLAGCATSSDLDAMGAELAGLEQQVSELEPLRAEVANLEQRLAEAEADVTRQGIALGELNGQVRDSQARVALLEQTVALMQSSAVPVSLFSCPAGTWGEALEESRTCFSESEESEGAWVCPLGSSAVATPTGPDDICEYEGGTRPQTTAVQVVCFSELGQPFVREAGQAACVAPMRALAFRSAPDVPCPDGLAPWPTADSLQCEPA